MLTILLFIFLLLAAILIFFRRFFLYAMGSVNPVYLRSFQACWERTSSLLDRPIEIQVFEMKILPIVHFFVTRSGDKIFLLGTKEYLQKLNQSPESEVNELITQKAWDVENALFQILWIFYSLKERVFLKLQALSPRLFSQLMIFLFLPLDTFLNFLWLKYSSRKEFDSHYWKNRPELWMELVG